jgi:hypothetical protein
MNGRNARVVGSRIFLEPVSKTTPIHVSPSFRFDLAMKKGPAETAGPPNNEKRVFSQSLTVLACQGRHNHFSFKQSRHQLRYYMIIFKKNTVYRRYIN